MFQVGDVVVCVSDCSCPAHADLPDCAPEMIGSVFRIRSLYESETAGCVGGATFISDPPGDEGWCLGDFRKVTKADEQFTASIRACRDAHEPVSA